MTQKLSERMYSMMFDLARTESLTEDRRRILDAARSIVQAWEDAPEVMAEFYSRPPMRALSGIAVDNLELLPLAGKRVKIMVVGNGRS